MTPPPRYNWKALRDFCFKVFQQAGVSADHAQIIAESLIEADLRGVQSHGMVRTSIYLERIEKSLVDPDSKIQIENESDATVLIEGNNNIGAVVGIEALHIAIDKAKIRGAGIVGVKGSNHFGTGAYYINQAIKEDMVLMVMSNASQTMPPTGGIRPFLGTNPFAIGAPTKEEPPFILDMATSVVARGKIIVAAQKDEEIPIGWAVDKHGQPTTNPHEALEGSVLPVGGPKGYGISMFVDILSGVLTGAGFGQYVNNMYENWQEPQNVGHFFIALDINQFIPIDIFKERLDGYLKEIKSEPKADGVEEILIPGEIEQRRSEEQKQNGIALPYNVVRELKQIGKKYHVRFPGESSVNISSV